jgi:hypothetical protein
MKIFFYLFATFTFINKKLQEHEGMNYAKNDTINGKPMPTLETITNNFQKQKLLHYLENKNINIHNKIAMIKQNISTDSVTTVNLTKGGLYDDWNFEM